MNCGGEMYNVKFLVGIVCYNNEKEVSEFVDNISNQTIIQKIAIVICCNHSNNIDILYNIKKKYINKFNIYIYCPKENLGYLNGCLYGIENVSIPYKWAVISNTDITFRSIDFFEKILKAKLGNNVWCIGPDIKLKYSDVSQNPFLCSRYSKFRFLFYVFIYNNLFLFVLYNLLSILKKKNYHVRQKNIHQNVYAVHGSIFILRNECIAKIIKIAKPIFLYGEEILVAEIIRKNNKETIFFPEISVLHNENQSTSKLNIIKKWRNFKKSFNYLLRINY